MGTSPKKPFAKMRAHHEALELLFTTDRSRYASFVEDDFLDAALEYASERDTEFLQRLYIKLSSALLFKHDVKSARLEAPDFTAVALDAQRWIAERLERIARSTPTDRLSLARELDADKEAQRIIFFPKTVTTPSSSGYSITRQMAWEAENPYPLLAQGLLHLLDTRWNHFNRLCHCKLESCGRWFLSKKTEADSRLGAFRTAYCCKEHAQAADADARRIRARERRARQKSQRGSRKVARKPK